jgi:hypothetical protein
LSGQLVKRVPDDLGNFTALTPQVQEKFLAELRKGDWPQLAAFRAGVAPKSVKRWLDKGVEDCAIEPYASFAAAVLMLEAELAGRIIKVVMDDAMGEGDWNPECGRQKPNVQSAIWLLQNRFRFFWGTKDGTVAPAAISITEHVEKQMATMDQGKRDKAKKILASLPSDVRANARKDGFLL